MTLSARLLLLCSALACLSLVAPDPAWADPPRKAKHAGRRHDVKHGHDRYYYPHGHKVHAVPKGHLRVSWHGRPYYYHAGVWYRPQGGFFVVGAAPIGVAVRWLPRYYTTVWIGGLPYYYANQTYYAWHPAERSYVVVEEPAGAAVTSSSDLFIYPTRGQSEQRQADDRYECHSWASRQTGYDPSLPLPGAQRRNAEQLRSDYLRAMSACLEGRGYTVR